LLILIEKQLLDRAKKEGFDIPSSRLASWREKGLVPTLDDRPGRGPASGRCAHTYTERGVEQTIAIARMRTQNLDFDEIGWRLWLDGYDVDSRWWRNTFELMAQQYDKLAAKIRKTHQSDELVDTNLDRMISAIYRSQKTSPIIKQIRKSLGEARFKEIMDEVARMATGTFEAISSRQQLEGSKEAPETKRAIDIALGLEHAQTDTVNGVGPIVQGDYTKGLQATFEPLKDCSLRKFLHSISPEELRNVTKSMNGLLDSIGSASEAFNTIYAKGAFGLRRAGMLAGADRNVQAVRALVWILIKRRSREEFHDLDHMAKLFLNAAIGARKLLEESKINPNFKKPSFHRASRPK
jgi:hypothetical protein